MLAHFTDFPVWTSVPPRCARAKSMASTEPPRTIPPLMTSAGDSPPRSLVTHETTPSALRARVLPVAALLVLCGLGVWTRLRDLGIESLWYDEAITFLRARLAIADLIADSIAQNHLPTYFVFMHYLLPLGDDEWWLRLPSAIFGMLKVPILAAIGWTLGGARVGLAAALLLVLSQPQLHYDQEARMYALQNLVIAVALLGQLWLLSHPLAAVSCFARHTPDPAQPMEDMMDRAIELKARMAWALWVGGAGLALWLHNTSALFLTASSCATVGLLIFDRVVRIRMFWYWVAANLLVLLLWCPWWPTLLLQLGDQGFGHKRFVAAPSARQVWDSVRMLMLGSRSGILNGSMFVLAMLGVFELRRRPVILLGLLLLSLLAPGQLLVLSQFKPLFVPRLFLWGTLAATVLAAHGVSFSRHGRWSALLVSALFGLITVLGLIELDRNYYQKQRKPDWRGAAQLLELRAAEPNVVVYAVNRRERKPLTYYAERERNRILVPPFIDAVPTEQPQLSKLPKAARRMLLVHEAKRERKGLPEIVKAAESRGRRISRTRLHGVTVVEYDLRGRAGASRRTRPATDLENR
jgi:mannosyltransferase